MTEVTEWMMHVWRYDHGAVLEFYGKHVTYSTSVDSSGQVFLAPHGW
jgi:hypothetical protein